MSTALDEAARLHRAGYSEEAEAVCRRHLQGRPDDHAALHLLGAIAFKSGRGDEAAELMRRSVDLAPHLPQYRVNLAAVIGPTDPQEALGHLLDALRRRSDIPELHNNVGVSLEKLGRAAEAVEAYQNALKLRADYPDARYNLGNALRKCGRFDQAEREYRQLLQAHPEYWKAYDGLAQVAVELGDAEQAIACQRRLVEHEPTNPFARSALLYTLHYSPDYDAEALYREHRQWGRLFCDPQRGTTPAHETDRDPERQLRIGYLSPDLCEHTPPRFIHAALEHRDRERFEVFAYSDVRQPDAVTEHLRSMCDHWRDTARLWPDQLDRLIRADRIDILVDLRGHAAGNRLPLFARRPAPVQVNMIGYFNTTGLGAMDYRTGDDRASAYREAGADRAKLLVLLAWPGIA